MEKTGKIIIAKPGVINSSKYKELKEAGYVVITAKDPQDIRIIGEYGDIDNKLLLESAIEALGHGNDATTRNAFGDRIRVNIQNKWFRESQAKKKQAEK